MKMNRIILPFLITLILLAPVAIYAQSDLTDMSETFRIFEEARNASAFVDLTSKDFHPTVPDDYKLGPGDTLQIMAGSLIMDVSMFQVSPQGQILIPPAGNIEIRDLTVKEAEDKIKQVLAVYLKEPVVQLQLIQARKIKVYLTGQAVLPGLYITFAGSSPVEFLQMASNLVDPIVTTGVDEKDFLSPYFRILNASGSRWVSVLRDGQKFAEVDLGDALMKGNIENELLLQDGDVIYIPEIKRPVIVSGGVVKPAKYEINSDENLTDLLLMAGGTTSNQYLSKVTVERETDFGLKMIEVPVNREYISLDPTFELRPGDKVMVPEVADFVYVLGGVWLPAAVDYHDGWKAIDYLAQTGGPTAPADWATIVVIRHAGSDDVLRIPVDLKMTISGNVANNPVIERGDIIWVPYKNKQWTGPGITGTILQFATFAKFLWG